jgi:hypothetical protein
MASRKRKTIEVDEEAVESPKLYDIAAVRIFLYENDLYRNGRYTSNKAFKDYLGEHGFEFDYVMRNTFQAFVRKLLHKGPAEILQYMLEYLVFSNVINVAYGKAYLAVTWRTQRVEVQCSYNLQTAISHYRTDFWRFLKSMIFRPSHLDTNLALSNVWGLRTTESFPGFVFRFGKLEISDDEFFSFREKVDGESLLLQNSNTVMGIPDIDHYDPDSKSFWIRECENIFDQFLELIDSTIRYIEECIADFRDNLCDENPEDAPFDKMLNELDTKLVSWKQDMYQVDLTVFSLAHEAIELCKRFHKLALVAVIDTKADTSTPLTPGVSTPASVEKRIPDFEMCYLSVKHFRILSDSVVNLRSSHVWLFFAYGRSPDSPEWVLNPCGHWNRTHESIDDFIKSETAELWMQRVKSISLITWARLCWYILFKRAPEITMKTSMEKDASFFNSVSL